MIPCDSSPRLRFATPVLAVALAAGASTCARTNPGSNALDDPGATDSGVRGATEGVLIIPSARAEEEYSPARLFELSEALRQPAARCFLERAIETMVVRPEDPRGYTGIPDGQMKLRIRPGDEGVVQQLDIVENGFDDPAVPECFAEIVRTRTWPETRTAYPPPLEVVYWVKIGPTITLPQHQAVVRRQTAEVGVRGKGCLQGRVAPGAYTFFGLNLVGAGGQSMASRVDTDVGTPVPEPVRDCLALAFRDLQLEPEADTFIRPVDLKVNYVVTPEGGVQVEDEEWLRLIQLEEVALRAERARQADAARGLSRIGGAQPRSPEDTAPEEAATSSPENEGTAVESSDEAARPDPGTSSRPTLDPGLGGLKLDLSGRGAPEP